MSVRVCVCVLMYLLYLTLFDGLLASYIVVKLEKIYEALNCASEKKKKKEKKTKLECNLSKLVQGE